MIEALKFSIVMTSIGALVGLVIIGLYMLIKYLINSWKKRVKK